MSFNTELSNMSYTNKDFNSIYTELLEYAKKLSYKWDPTSSDESDPGVVLLKLAAIIGDKDSYNIDKNILELMPASVTQMSAARQLFDQCGYSMRYYRAAQGDVNITIKSDLGDDLEEQLEGEVYSYAIPQFTMFTDTDSSIVYTSTSPLTIESRTETSIPVIEGTVAKYTVNNDALITMQNLDNNNRLYFTETNIAENGIFITTVDSTKPNFTNYEEWTCVDNIQVQPRGTLCYKFGVTIDGSVCYIEFPDDIESILGEGLNISYILTNGSAGNISAGKIKQFYVDTKFTRSSSNTTPTQVDATIDKLSIKNTLPIMNGQDPESIDDAYKNYKRVRDTFNTLVSLKDYSDYLVTSKTASNGFVCDRTNDIQRSYKVVTTEEGSTYVKTMVELVPGDWAMNVGTTESPVWQPQQKESMDPFTLCAYAFEWIAPVTNTDQLATSFNLVDLTNDVTERYKHTGTIYKSTQDNLVESLQHEYIGFDDNKILLLKNKYPITVNIVPKYPLSTIEKMEVLYNAEKAMCAALNSSQMTFGEAVDAEVVQNAVLNSDERIKTLIDFTSPKYETYAVYQITTQDDEGNDVKEFKELRIDNDSYDGGYYVYEDVTPDNFSTVADESSPDGSLYFRTLGGAFVKVSVPDTSYSSEETYYKYNSDLSKLWNRFRLEIFAKNVLAGVTPLYTDNNVYTIGVAQTNSEEITPVTKISTNVDIYLQPNENETVYVSEELKENENILLTCPNLEEENNYSSYVKVLYKFNENNKTPTGKVLDGSIHELTKGEYIIFFWKDSDVSEYYTYVKYDSTSSGKYIVPSSYNMTYVQDLTTSSYFEGEVIVGAIHTYFGGPSVPVGKGSTKNLPLSTDPFINKKKDENNYIRIYDPTKYVKDCLISPDKGQVLTGTQTIYTKNIKERFLNNSEDGSQNFSWILNQKQDEKFVFPTGTKYTLESGEYFMYTNDDKTTLYMLGEGTTIDTTHYSNETWVVDAIDYNKILLEGMDYIRWFKVARKPKEKNDECIKAIENQRIQIGPKNHIRLTLLPNTDLSETPIIKSTDELKLQNYTIEYIDDKGTVTNVPEMNGSEVYWSAKSILNLDMSSKHPQKLEENQTITLTSSEATTSITGSSSTPRYIQCTEALNRLGGQNIDLTAIYGKKKSIGFLHYELQDTATSTTDESSNVTVIQLPQSAKDEDILKFDTTINYAGLYLLQLEFSDTELTELSVSVSPSSIVDCLVENKLYKVNASNGETNITIGITYDTAEEGPTLTIPALYRYSKKNLEEIPVPSNLENPAQPATFEEQLLKMIQDDTTDEDGIVIRRALDRDKCFDYMYQPVNPIYNPLVATSFLKKDHFYNKYTICQWDANTEETLTVHDVIR